LTENPSVTLGVIEAGLQIVNEPKIDVPCELAITLKGSAFLQVAVNVGQTLFDPKFDWNFPTAPQSALNGRSIPSSRCDSVLSSLAIWCSDWPFQRETLRWLQPAQWHDIRPSIVD
jgi:hypothetical protein